MLVISNYFATKHFTWLSNLLTECQYNSRHATAECYACIMHTRVEGKKTSKKAANKKEKEKKTHIMCYKSTVGWIPFWRSIFICNRFGNIW